MYVHVFAGLCTLDKGTSGVGKYIGQIIVENKCERYPRIACLLQTDGAHAKF